MSPPSFTSPHATIRGLMRWISIGLRLFALAADAATPGMSVIDRATIERYHFTSVARAIEISAGMDVIRTYFKPERDRGAWDHIEEHYANKNHEE